MTEVLFDPRTSEVVLSVGPAKTGSAGGDLLPLSDLLIADKFPYPPGTFQEKDVANWDREECLAIGRMALKALERADGAPRPLTTEHLKRLKLLGISPYSNIYKRDFGNFSAYKEAIGSPIRYDRLKYKGWTTAEYVAYAEQTYEKLGQYPSNQDYREQFDRGEGPSLKMINDRFGGIKVFHRRLSYPHRSTEDWIEDDFITWGINVMKANPDESLSLVMVKILSRRGVGPSTQALTKKCDGGWAGLKAKIIDEGALQIEAEATTRFKNLDSYIKLENEGKLPISSKNLTEKAKRGLSGRHAVIEAVARGVTVFQRTRLLKCHSKNFISQLLTIRPDLTAGHIEMRAISLDVFDDIWPVTDTASSLHVSRQEMDKYRQKSAEQLRCKRAKSRLGPSL
ncbi:MAG: hypothetical protein ABI602_04195 [Candidatus Saccharibacteria bacterium]